ncbi:MAG: hypothetical protein PVJ55_06930 [Anaerolineae bacterium]|jgi:hypothetical protein
MPLNDRARIILFWFTIILLLAIAILAAVAILRACGGLPTQTGPPLSVTPPEVSLCPGDQQQFAVTDDLEVTWEADGGTISEEGVFTAGELAGDYTVSATRDETGQAAGAIVHVTACTPTPTATPLPTVPPTPTQQPAETSEPTQPAESSPSSQDPEGDVGEYDTGAVVESPPAGVDIVAASISPDSGASFRPTDDLPADLEGWIEDGEAFFWMSLRDGVPDPPPGYMNWLFVIDTDGSTETGRAVGSRRINPDLGDEVAIGVTYNAETEAYEPYSLVWNTEEAAWATGPEVRYTFGESRAVLGLAVSLEGLEEAISQAGAAPFKPEAAKGRAAAETYLTDGTRVIDFYPDLPE